MEEGWQSARRRPRRSFDSEAERGGRLRVGVVKPSEATKAKVLPVDLPNWRSLTLSFHSAGVTDAVGWGDSRAWRSGDSESELR